MLAVIEAHDYKVEILYEDEWLIFLNKPSSLLVHPYPQETNEKINLLKIVRDHLGHYVYPVHRLDRPVSGVIVFCKKPELVKLLQDQWRDEVEKKYLALVRGHPDKIGEFSFSLNNEQKVLQEAKTSFKILEYYPDCALAEIKIHTGRKHQIRRHFSRRMHHVIGDTRYGKGRINHYFRDEYGISRIFLHSYQLSVTHPVTEVRLIIKSELPLDLSNALCAIKA